MKNSIKGALLSGLVFPGLGHVVLRHYKRGVALMLTVSLSLLILVMKATRQAFIILKKIEAEGLVIDMSTISSAAAQASTASASLVYNFILFLIIFLWIIGIVDAYRLGRKMDVEEHSTNEVSNSTEG
jgi:hypothetical protein